jgi:epoxyqueuosine reductase
VLDARRCIAYWTIEARAPAPTEWRPKLGRWFFGCDVCQEVCPHNHHPPPGEEDDLLPRNAWVDLVAVLEQTDDALMERFLGTPLRRPGPDGLKRNAAIVLGNLADPSARGALVRYGLSHPSPQVQDASRWALARLDAGSAASETETDGPGAGAARPPR